MSRALYFTGGEVSSYKSAIRNLAQGNLGRPTHVDIHTQTACNAKCPNCIGNSGAEFGRLEIKILPENIGFILDQVTNVPNPPAIHFAGFTGDPFVTRKAIEGSVTGFTNTTIEGIVHLIKRGMAEKASVVTNGIGFSGQPFPDWEIDPSIKWMNSEVGLLPFIGSVQINLNASYGRSTFEDVMHSIEQLDLQREIFGGDYYRNGYGDALGINNKWPYEKSPMKIVVNVFLNSANYRTLPALLAKLGEEEYAFVNHKLTVEKIKYSVDEIRVRMDLFQRANSGFQSKIISLVEKLSAKYADQGLEITIKYPPVVVTETSFDRCISPFFWPAVGQDGRVYSCAHTVSPGFALGSLWENTLDQILTDYYQSGRWKNAPSCKRMCPSTAGSINLLGAEVLNL